MTSFDVAYQGIPPWDISGDGSCPNFGCRCNVDRGFLPGTTTHATPRVAGNANDDERNREPRNLVGREVRRGCDVARPTIWIGMRVLGPPAPAEGATAISSVLAEGTAFGSTPVHRGPHPRDRYRHARVGTYHRTQVEPETAAFGSLNALHGNG